MTRQDVSETVVTSQGYTHGQLTKVFDDVTQLMDNWKMPIDSTCKKDDVDMVREAIIFFTGSVPYFSDLDGDRVNVTALGYYNAIGA